MKKLKSIKEFDEIRGNLIEQGPKERLCITISSGTCGQARGSASVVKAFEEKLKSNGWRDKVSMRVTGCHGFCEVEPTVLIYPEGILYQKVKPEDADQIISETVINHRIIDRLLYLDPVTKRKSVREEEIPFYQIRHIVRPGITGWAQIRYPYGASKKDALEKLKYDLYYIKHMSIFFDLMIAFGTAKIVLLGKGAR